MRQAIRVAKKMGARLAKCSLLQRTLSPRQLTRNKLSQTCPYKNQKPNASPSRPRHNERFSKKPGRSCANICQTQNQHAVTTSIVSRSKVSSFAVSRVSKNTIHIFRLAARSCRRSCGSWSSCLLHSVRSAPRSHRA